MYLLRWSHKYVDGRMPLSLSDSSQLMATFDKKKMNSSAQNVQLESL